MAIETGIDGRWREAFAWLALAVVIDAVDGFFARLVRVKEVLPDFDGGQLDNVIDYASYVLVPAFLLHRAALLPPEWSFWGASGIVLASAYQFCQVGAKTSDHFFKGFPSYWNVAVLYLLALQLDPITNLAIIATLIVSVFVPIKYIYPSRTIQLRKLTMTLATIWGIALIAIVWQLPNPSPRLVHLSLLFVLYYVCASLYLAIERSRAGS